MNSKKSIMESSLSGVLATCIQIERRPISLKRPKQHLLQAGEDPPDRSSLNLSSTLSTMFWVLGLKNILIKEKCKGNRVT